MIINGGISYKDTYISDSWVFDCGASSWKQLTVEGLDPNGRAFHTSCSVFAPNKGSFELYKPIDSKGESKNYLTPKQEGIYYFGGRNGRGEILGNLEILQLGKINCLFLNMS